MAKNALAEIYARALVEAAENTGALAQVREAAEAVLEAWNQSPELKAVLAHPGVDLKDKHKLVKSCFGDLGVELMTNALGVLVDKGRIGHLGPVLEAFGQLCDEREGVARGSVVTAAPLDDTDRRSIAAALADRFGRNVVLDEEVDPKMIGGFRARVGDLVFDATVLAQLQKMADSLGDLAVPAGVWQEE